ncbi:MAG: hypothetical protein J6N52_06940 [Clostridia bacterium]|nr:hypothetical protein [Clostridia bacterium]
MIYANDSSSALAACENERTGNFGREEEVDCDGQEFGYILKRSAALQNN